MANSVGRTVRYTVRTSCRSIETPYRSAWTHRDHQEVQEVRGHEDREHDACERQRLGCADGVDVGQHRVREQGADDWEERPRRDVVERLAASSAATRSRRSRDETTPIATAGAGPSSVIARTIARNAPDTRMARTSTVSRSLPTARTNSRDDELDRVPVGRRGGHHGYGNRRAKHGDLRGQNEPRCVSSRPIRSSAGHPPDFMRFAALGMDIRPVSRSFPGGLRWAG